MATSFAMKGFCWTRVKILYHSPCLQPNCVRSCVLNVDLVPKRQRQKLSSSKENICERHMLSQYEPPPPFRNKWNSFPDIFRVQVGAGGRGWLGRSLTLCACLPPRRRRSGDSRELWPSQIAAPPLPTYRERLKRGSWFASIPLFPP